MQPKAQHQTIVAILLLAISILSLSPRFAHADQPNPMTLLTINATGQATPMTNGPSGPTTLTLTATCNKTADKWLVIQNTTGTVKIDTTTFNITGGQGSMSPDGDIAIFANTNTGKSQLILHGSTNGTGVNFSSPQSQLVSTAYLSLSGSLNQGSAPQSAGVDVTPSTVSNVTAATATSSNRTQGENSTSIQATAVNNTTQINTVNATASSSNSTQIAQLTRQTSSNTTAANKNPPILTQSGNATVTVTQYLNQTISATQTVANVTISYTVTTTVANSTITEANATMTVTATTGT